MESYGRYFNDLQALRRVAKSGVEYWTGRDLQEFFAYSSWERFEGVVARAIKACDNSGQPASHHFHRYVKMIDLGKGAQREIPDWYLTRYASYLVAMNGDSSKPEIAYAQAYFAVQTRKQEIHEELGSIDQRLALRERMKEANKGLTSAAHDAGVRKYGAFHDAGYRGLYGGLSQADIKELKGLERKENLLDRMDSAELAANYFRATQAQEKIRRDRIVGEREAITTHKQVGEEVRRAIERIDGVMPEKLPPAPPIGKLKTARKKLLKHAPTSEAAPPSEE